jgi:hypothetical protein
VGGSRMEMAPGHGRLLAALEAADYRAKLRDAGEPTIIEARPGVDRRRGFSIYLWTLDVEVGVEASAYSALPRGRRPDWERGLLRIALHHLPERDVYAALPPRSGPSKAVVFFRPEEVAAHLDSLAGERWPTPQRTSAPDRVRDRRVAARAADRLESFQAREISAELRRELRDERARTIETGFSRAGSPADALDPELPLEPASEYLFWFGVGFRTGVSIEREPVGIPADIPVRARLAVEVFGFEGELTPTGPNRGTIEVTPERGARVLEPALSAELPGGIGDRRLLFPLRTPRRPGTHRLRCSLYYGSTLLQSRLVTARVGGEREPGARAVESVLDYRIAADLDLASLAEVPEHDLSISLNGNEDFHQLRLYSTRGKELFSNEASLPSGKVKTSIEAGRKALRRASWGTAEDWGGKPGTYRYGDQRIPLSQLEGDLVALARAGARLYSELAKRLAGGVAAREVLEKLSASPARIQIASGPDGLYVPAGLFYDHRIDRRLRGRVKLCADFSQALAGEGRRLQDAPCMVEGCCRREDPAVVCPSGFWGFRHELGWPASTDTPVTRLPCEGGPEVLIGVSTDAGLKLRRRHVRDVEALAPRRSVLAETLDDFDAQMRRREAHLVYLYCHGGMDEEEAFVELGAPQDEDRITYDHLRQGKPWGVPPPHSLVFINGCHTTALGPEQVLDLVTGFVEEAKAAGVIGTELTVFERLACDFAAAMLPGFLSGAETVGAAVRHARLELLRARNPLGLAYVPFVAADTRLVAI